MVLPQLLLDLAVRALPPQHRDRYRRELGAELHDLPRSQQLAHAARVLLRAGALRSAIRGSSSPSAASPGRPWGCRTGVRHRWRRLATEDGGRYVGCARCPAVRGYGGTTAAIGLGEVSRTLGPWG